MTNRHVIVSAIAGLVALAAGPAWAQPIPIGGPSAVITVPGSVTSDQAAEASLADIDTIQLPPIVASLTTTTNAPTDDPNPLPLGNIGDIVGTGVNSQNAGKLMPVTQGLPCKSDEGTIATAIQLKATYLNAIQATEGLANQLQGESLQQISANVQAPYELASTQGSGQAILDLIREVRLERAQTALLTNLIAAQALWQLDSATRDLLPRQGYGCRQ